MKFIFSSQIEGISLTELQAKTIVGQNIDV